MKIEYLPIGSVVLLNESVKKVMIMGFAQASPDNVEQVYDYCGCLYPEGYMDPNKVYLFNNEQIAAVYSIGYMDAEQHEFADKLATVMAQVRGESEQ